MLLMERRFNPYSNGRYSTRGGEHGHAEHSAAEVLILILMEDTLRACCPLRLTCYAARCLNPYSNGRYSTRTLPPLRRSLGTASLNPYSNGRYSTRLKISDEQQYEVAS